jgi:Protein of unknown function (DUF3800)
MIPSPVMHGGWVSFYHVYADESGKLTGKSDYTSLCGYVGHDSEWARFNSVWNSCRLKWKIPPVHMSRIMNPDRKEDKWCFFARDRGNSWDSTREHMLYEFSNIVYSSAVVAVGGVVDAESYRAIQTSSRPFYTKDSNVFAFHHLVTNSIKKIQAVDERAGLSVVVDDDPENAWGYYNMQNVIKRHEDPRLDYVKGTIDSICFGDDRAYPGLQAADMLSWCACNQMILQKTGQRDPGEPSDLYLRLTHTGLHQPGFYDKTALEKLSENIANAIKKANNEQP